tara:strand:- start:562 stop:1083 length:522 start_codon:yes stop_codon:yes gene_type:complete
MSFDLTNKNISNTFQNLLQKTGSDGRLYDLEGNQVNDLTLTNVSASGHISASSFIGDGSKLTGLSSAAISTYNNSGDNRVVTSVNSTTVNSEANLTFDGSILNVNGEITSSKVTVGATDTNDFFLLKSGSLNSLKVNGEGVLQLGAFSFTPTAVKGGIYYDDTEDEFFVGKNN